MKPRRRNYRRKYCGGFHIDSPRLRHKGRLSNHHFLKGELLTDTVTGQPFVSSKKHSMAFFNSAIGILQTLFTALGAGLGTGDAINLLESYGNDNPGANACVW